MIVIPVCARSAHSASVFPISGLSSGTRTHSISSSPSASSRSSTIFGRSYAPPITAPIWRASSSSSAITARGSSSSACRKK
jgi:hypothetical protein